MRGEEEEEDKEEEEKEEGMNCKHCRNLFRCFEESEIEPVSAYMTVQREESNLSCKIRSP